MIKLSIDVTKIDKSLIVPGREKNGRTPKYVDLVLFDNRNGRDEFGNDGFVVQGLTKERRNAGEKGPIVGNWKDTDQGTPGTSQAPAPAPAQGPAKTPYTPPTKGDVPF